MELIFEQSVAGRGCSLLPDCDVPQVAPSKLRTAPPRLPEVSENDISRHYTRLAAATHGVNKGCYPLGSCTMKYNPKLNDELAALRAGGTPPAKRSWCPTPPTAPTPPAPPWPASRW